MMRATRQLALALALLAFPAHSWLPQPSPRRAWRAASGRAASPKPLHPLAAAADDASPADDAARLRAEAAALRAEVEMMEAEVVASRPPPAADGGAKAAAATDEARESCFFIHTCSRGGASRAVGGRCKRAAALAAGPGRARDGGGAGRQVPRVARARRVAGRGRRDGAASFLNDGSRYISQRFVGCESLRVRPRSRGRTAWGGGSLSVDASPKQRDDDI